MFCDQSHRWLVPSITGAWLIQTRFEYRMTGVNMYLLYPIKQKRSRFPVAQRHFCVGGAKTYIQIIFFLLQNFVQGCKWINGHVSWIMTGPDCQWSTPVTRWRLSVYSAALAARLEHWAQGESLGACTDKAGFSTTFTILHTLLPFFFFFLQR